MKKLFFSLMFVLATVAGYSQVSPGTYKLATITINSSGTITAIDSAEEVDPTVDVAVKSISNTDQDHWNSGYTAYTWGNPNGVFLNLSGSYDNPQFLTNIAVGRINWEGTTSQYVRGDGSIVTFPIPKRQETYSGTTNSSGVYTITYSTGYTVTPNVQFVLNNGTNKQTILLTSSTASGCSFYVQARTDVLGLLPSYSNVNGAAVDVLVTEK